MLLMSFFELQFDLCNLEGTGLFIENLLQKVKCLILLDGLDELQAERKYDIIREIIDFSEKHY